MEINSSTLAYTQTQSRVNDRQPSPPPTPSAAPSASNATQSTTNDQNQRSNTPPVSQAGASQSPTLNLQGQKVGTLINVTA